MGGKDKKYYWLRLKRDFFKRHDIQIIEAMPNGKDYILFYLKLLCESVDHEGNLRFSDAIPYSEQMLATITNTNIDVVRSATKVFIELKMMDVMDDGTYYMCEVNKMIGVASQDDHTRESTRQRVKAFRERKNKKKQLLTDGLTETERERYSNGSCNENERYSNVTDRYSNGEERYSNVTQSYGNVTCNGEIELEIEKDINNIYMCNPTVTDAPILDDSKPKMHGEVTETKKPDKKQQIQKDANALFERLWKKYPNKKGKGQVSDSKKRALLEVGEEHMSRAITRYIEEHDKRERHGEFTPYWQNGSTFFNRGYIDYLDDNYSSSPSESHGETTGFVNFRQSETNWDAIADQIMQLEDEIPP